MEEAQQRIYVGLKDAERGLKRGSKRDGQSCLLILTEVAQLHPHLLGLSLHFQEAILTVIVEIPEGLMLFDFEGYRSRFIVFELLGKVALVGRNGGSGPGLRNLDEEEGLEARHVETHTAAFRC